jgi:hypothetical protein
MKESAASLKAYSDWCLMIVPKSTSHQMNNLTAATWIISPTVWVFIQFVSYSNLQHRKAMLYLLSVEEREMSEKCVLLDGLTTRRGTGHSVPLQTAINQKAYTCIKVSWQSGLRVFNNLTWTVHRFMQILAFWLNVINNGMGIKNIEDFLMRF